MTVNFEKLVQVALLGTERQAPPIPAGVTPVAALQRQLDPSNREQCLLSMAALAVSYERAGWLPLKSEAAGIPVAAPETAPRVSEHAGQALLRLLKGELRALSSELLAEWLSLAASSNQLPPPEALPLLLDLGSKRPEMRPSLLPVLGERGRWLAGLNAAWNWVHATESPDESTWHTGEPADRIAYLRTLRRSDPAKARELLNIRMEG